MVGRESSPPWLVTAKRVPSPRGHLSLGKKSHCKRSYKEDCLNDGTYF